MLGPLAQGHPFTIRPGLAKPVEHRVKAAAAQAAGYDMHVLELHRSADRDGQSFGQRSVLCVRKQRHRNRV
jgi:hypothetical protein